MMKKVIYTCITGDYDTVKEPKFITPGWDYICFTNNPKLTSVNWRIQELPDDHGLDNTRLARRVKILPHEYLKNYDLSIWVDANLTVSCDLDYFTELSLVDGNLLALMTHGQRDCIYDEGHECIKQNKDDSKVILDHLAKYEESEYPHKNGMVQTGIQIRKHNDETLIDLNEHWFKEVRDGSKRDQLSFNFVVWMLDFTRVNLFRHTVLFDPTKFPIAQHNHGW